MQTDSDSSTSSTAPFFDMGMARERSLAATLSRVRRQRRVRYATRVSLALLAAGGGIMELLQPAPGPAPVAQKTSPGSGRVVSSGQQTEVVRARLLSPVQKVVTAASAGDIVLKTRHAPAAGMYFSTPQNVEVARIDDGQLRYWLAQQDAAFIQTGKGPGRIVYLNVDP